MRYALQNWWLTFLYWWRHAHVVHTECGGCGEALTDAYEQRVGICQSCNAW